MIHPVRVVVPGLPHHVTQRGNRRETVFFCVSDYQVRPNLARTALSKFGSQIRAWFLMPNRVHFIVVSSDEDGLRCSVADAHRRYSASINTRNK